MASRVLEENIVDSVSLGTIVQIRDQLLNMQRQGKKVYRLESGDPSFKLPDHIMKGIDDAMKSGKTHYTDSTGIPELREAISRKLKDKNKIKGAVPESVFVTNGGMNGLYVGFRSLISPGDEVVIPNPMWTEIAEIIKLSGGKPIYVPIERYTDLENVLGDKKPKVVFINSPHNPTGRIFKPEEVSKVVEFANDSNAFIVSDEAYEDVIFDGNSHLSPGSIYEDTLSLYSMSKSYAMSGLRLGYVHTNNPKIKERIKKMLRCTINGVNSITQYGAIAALNGPQQVVEDMRKEYQLRRDLIFHGAKGSRYLEPFFPGGAFYLWTRIKEYPEGKKDSWDFSKYLLERTAIGSTPGPTFGPDNEDYIRFAFSTKTEDIREAAELIREMD